MSIIYFLIAILHLNPIRTRGGHIVPPLSRICVYLGKYTYKRIEKNLTFLSYECGKGQYTFYPVDLSLVSLEKNKVYGKYQNFIRGDPYELVKRLFDGL